MTEDEMRQLDHRLIKAMGHDKAGWKGDEPVYWVKETRQDGIPIAYWAEVPRFSTDGAAMLALMGWLTANKYAFCLDGHHDNPERCEAAIWRGMEDDPGGAAVAATFPLALALAADAALAREGRP